MSQVRQDLHVFVGRFVGVLYWLSIACLLWGVWLLIDPFGRETGQRQHVYITLISLESYIVAMLVLARWQRRHNLAGFVIRSGLYVLALTGVIFMALNELHNARALEAYVLSPLFVAFSILHLWVGRRWLRLQISNTVLVLAGVWIVMLALPAHVLRLLMDEFAAQHVAGWLFCWLVALFVALHLILVLPANRRVAPNRFLENWLILLVPAVLVTIQLYTSMWSMDVEWAQWYFSPIYLALAILLVFLSKIYRLLQTEAWILMTFTAGLTLGLAQDALPRAFPQDAFGPVGTMVLHPGYLAGTFSSGLLLLGGYCLSHLGYYLAGIIAPVSWGAIQFGKFLIELRSGRGILLVLSAFALLGLGAALQWWQQCDRDLRGIPSKKDETTILPTIKDEA